MPRRTSVHAHVVHGDLTVEGVTGDHELSNVNGEVSATDLGGSAVVNTTNGAVRVSFTRVAPDKAMSFSSFNGDVDVTFPANLAADLLGLQSNVIASLPSVYFLKAITDYE